MGVIGGRGGKRRSSRPVLRLDCIRLRRYFSDVGGYWVVRVPSITGVYFCFLPSPSLVLSLQSQTIVSFVPVSAPECCDSEAASKGGGCLPQVGAADGALCVHRGATRGAPRAALLRMRHNGTHYAYKCQYVPEHYSDFRAPLRPRPCPLTPGRLFSTMNSTFSVGFLTQAPHNYTDDKGQRSFEHLLTEASRYIGHRFRTRGRVPGFRLLSVSFRVLTGPTRPRYLSPHL